MSISSPLLPIHWILLKNTVEHIRAINLTAQISIVSSIIATDEMTECSLTVAPIRWEAEGLRAFDAGDLEAEVVVEFGELEGFGCRVRFGAVDCHIEDAEVELAEVEEGIVDVLGLDLKIDKGVWNLFAGLVVLAQILELFFSPAPVLEHLTWGFDEIANDGSTVEARVLGTASKIVDSVS